MQTQSETKGVVSSTEALIARLGKATEPSKELDGSIWWEVIGKEGRKALDPFGSIAEHIKREGSAGRALAQYYSSADPSCLANIAFIQRYTESLDDALTLVPKGWSWRAGNTPSGGFASLGTQKSLQDVMGATPALAICIAALEARAAVEETTSLEAAPSQRSSPKPSEAQGE